MATFIRLVDFGSAEQKKREFFKTKNYYEQTQKKFHLIPNCPIAYWVSKNIYDLYSDGKTFSKNYLIKEGLGTRDDEIFMRRYWEIGSTSIGRGKRWIHSDKAGEKKRWFGLINNVLFWENDGQRIRNHMNSDGTLKSRPQNIQFFYRNAVTWNKVSTGNPSFRYRTDQYAFNDAAPSLFGSNLVIMIGLLNSIALSSLLSIEGDTINISVGAIGRLPIVDYSSFEIAPYVECNLSISKSDWDLHETSWDFLRSPLLADYAASRIETVIDENLTDWSWPSAFTADRGINLAARTDSFKTHWTALFLDLHRNEEELNRIFIDLYGLQDELTPKVPFTEITILQEELVEAARKEGRIEFDEGVLARQFVSWGVGCLMGRYSAEKDGLILADAGAGLDDFKARVPDARFLPDQDGILPLTDEDDFPDDLPTAFKAWLRFISGGHYNDNLGWIEERLGKDLRAYFDRDFYREHVRRYKSRPIYWMVSSPSGAFRALVYLHRYTRDTAGKILNDYLRPWRTKLDQKIRGLESIVDSVSSSAGEKTRAKKRLAQLEKYRIEIEGWEKDALHPTAQRRIELDLDDGVKVNYRKLGAILEPVKQLEMKEDE